MRLRIPAYAYFAFALVAGSGMTLAARQIPQTAGLFAGRVQATVAAKAPRVTPIGPSQTVVRPSVAPRVQAISVSARAISSATDSAALQYLQRQQFLNAISANQNTLIRVQVNLFGQAVQVGSDLTRVWSMIARYPTPNLFLLRQASQLTRQFSLLNLRLRTNTVAMTLNLQSEIFVFALQKNANPFAPGLAAFQEQLARQIREVYLLSVPRPEATPVHVLAP
jgi:hypothetical protein